MIGSSRILFLVPPLGERLIRGGASAVEYPVRLAQAAARLPGSKLIDAASQQLSIVQVVLLARGFGFCVLQGEGPYHAAARRTARALRQAYPKMRLGLADPANPAGDIPPFDLVISGEVDLESEAAVTGRPAAGCTDLVGVIKVLKRDLDFRKYEMPFLRHPHLSLLTGRGPRRQSPRIIAEDVREAQGHCPQLREIFLDDDMLLQDPQRAIAVGHHLAQTGIAWSTRARPAADLGLLRELRAKGLRLLVVDYGQGAGQGPLPPAQRFARACRELDIRLHGSFTLGSPDESRKTIRKTIRYACALDVDSIHVSVKTPAASSGLDDEDIQQSLFRMYTRFYLRPSALIRSLRAVCRYPHQRQRRLRIGRNFLRFLWERPIAIRHAAT